MRMTLTAALLAGATLVAPSLALGYPARTDVIWARNTNGAPITLDGILNEPAWAQAESKRIQYRVDAGIPGSGWKEEGGILAPDKTDATIKFLAVGNKIYMGAVIKDNSIGGSKDFNRFDGLLMCLKSHLSGSPGPVNEYLYSWWYPTDPDTLDPGQGPTFKGTWAEEPPGSPRTPAQIDAWDAVTTVQGLANRDSVGASSPRTFVPDTSYTIEMVFNLTPMGYDITDADGDIVEWNVSIYDCDAFWPLNIFRFSSNRTWWQSPWGNVGWYHEVRLCAKPSVTITSGAVPELAPEFIVPSASGLTAPVINGTLTEPVWASAPVLPIRFDDTALRESYPGVARWRSGQFQTNLNPPNPLPPVDDPADVGIKYFFKGNHLYLGFTFSDVVVQNATAEDQWDGFNVSINDRAATNSDHVLFPRRLTCRVGPSGAAAPQDYLATLVASGGAEVAFAMNPGTVVSNAGADPGVNPDNGYTAELKIDLTQLGYPVTLGDHLLFLGIDIYDGDTFIPLQNSTATRTWWFREREGDASSAWAYMDPTVGVVAVDLPEFPTELQMGTVVPNPFRDRATLHFALPQPGRVLIKVFDLQGRVVSSRDLGVMAAGRQQAPLTGQALDPGLYLYRLSVSDVTSGADLGARSGKIMLVR